ncbi:MAG: hypothetical protein EXQ47_01130 [Bryobacterales bacterium]|nr:hypothetical protein [Bryobacterales bacterium]
MKQTRYVAIAAALLMSAGAVSAQTLKPAPAAKNSAWVQGKTPDGQPDLQGTWTNATNVPLQRPKELGAKEFFTPQEQADFQAKAKGYAGDRANLPEAHYDLSQFGLDRSQGKFAPNLRTSTIAGPEGRLPAFTPEGQKRIAARAAALKGREADGPENRNLGERCIVSAAGGTADDAVGIQ